MSLICEGTAEIPGRLATLPLLTSGSFLHILLGSNQWRLGQKSTREDIFTDSQSVAFSESCPHAGNIMATMGVISEEEES